MGIINLLQLNLKSQVKMLLKHYHLDKRQTLEEQCLPCYHMGVVPPVPKGNKKYTSPIQ